MNWNTKSQRRDGILDLTHKGITFQKLGINGNWKRELIYMKGEDVRLGGKILPWLQTCLLPQDKKWVVLDDRQNSRFWRSGGSIEKDEEKGK